MADLSFLCRIEAQYTGAPEWSWIDPDTMARLYLACGEHNDASYWADAGEGQYRVQTWVVLSLAEIGRVRHVLSSEEEVRSLLRRLM